MAQERNPLTGVQKGLWLRFVAPFDYAPVEAQGKQGMRARNPSPDVQRGPTLRMVVRDRNPSSDF
jgi:hypothetical protein